MSSEIITPESAAETESLRVERAKLLDAIGSSDVSELALHNFSGDPLTLYKLEALARGVDCHQGSEQVDAIIPMKWWYCHRAAAEGRDGEIELFPRVVLITPKLEGYCFGSLGVFDCLRMLIKYFGTREFDPPLMLKVAEVKTRKGRKMLTLIPQDLPQVKSK